MGRSKSKSNDISKNCYPGSTPESRENQLVALAIARAEEQLRNGTASSQVITHYLKLGSPAEKLKRELLEKQIELAEAKKNSYQSAQNLELMFREAMKAMSEYKGEETIDEYTELY